MYAWHASGEEVSSGADRPRCRVIDGVSRLAVGAAACGRRGLSPGPSRHFERDEHGHRRYPIPGASQYAPRLRNVRPFVDRPSIQQAIDVGLNAAANMQEHARTSPGCCCRSSDKLKTRCGPTQETGPTLTGWRRGAVNIITTVLKPGVWLQNNQNKSALAVNHFGSTQSARNFCARPVPAPAPKRVIVPETSIQDEDDLGPYADLHGPYSYQRFRRPARRFTGGAKREMDTPTTSDVNDKRRRCSFGGIETRITRLKGTQMLCRKPQESAKKPESFVGRRLSKLT